MSPSLRRLIDWLWKSKKPQPDNLSADLRKQLNRRPRAPFRGASSHLLSLFLTRPYAATLLLQHIVPLFRPLTAFGPAVFYDKHRDVRDILDRDDDFPSGPTIGPGLVSGDFVLGMDRCPLHREDLAMLWEALYQIPPPAPGQMLPKNGPGPVSKDVDEHLKKVGWFRRLDEVVLRPIEVKVRGAIDDALKKKGRQHGRIDLVQEVFRRACAELLVQQYFGVGPDDKEWTRALWDILKIIGTGVALPYNVPLTNKYDPVIREVKWAKYALQIAVFEAVTKARERYDETVTKPKKADEQAIAQANAALTAAKGASAGAGDETSVNAAHKRVVASSETAKAAHDMRVKAFVAQSDLVGRMYAVFARRKVPEDDIPAAILRNVVGLAIAGCAPVAKAAAQAVDIFLSRPLAMRGASDAARSAINPNASPAQREANRALFWEYIFEALRFFPPFPLLTRACPRDTSIGTGQDDRRKVSAGQTVVAGMLPAMFDEEAVPFPDQFRTDRAPGDSLVFGRGLHACLGFQVAREVLVAMLLPLFAHPAGFERIWGRKGKLRFDLLAVENLFVKFK
jgi:cytochrome P450